MPVYTFSNIFKKEILIFQVDADNYDDASKKWCDAIIDNTDKLNVTVQYLNKQLNKVKINKIMQNTWSFIVQIKGSQIIVYFSKVHDKEENNYEIEDAAEFIFENLPENLAGRIDRQDIYFVLETADEYMIKMENDKRQKIIKDDADINEYIRKKARKKDLSLLKDDIETILDLELEYLRKIGFVDPDKCYYLGLSFNKPLDN